MVEKIKDFGFSFSSEDDIKAEARARLDEHQEKLTNAQRKVLGLKEMFFPFLDSLMGDPLKNVIVWPNRIEQIKKFKKEIEDFIIQGE